MFIDGDSAAIEEQTKLFGGKKWTEVKESTHTYPPRKYKLGRYVYDP